jgi:hypothetical protein
MGTLRMRPIPQISGSMALVAVGANKLLHDLMILLVHGLELTRPAQFKFCDAGLGGA